MFNWSKLTYLPVHPAPFVLALVALVGLNALGATPLKLITLGQNLTPSGILAAAVLLGVINAIALWRHVRVRYLTVRSALLPFLTTMVILSVVGAVSGVAGPRIVAALGWTRPDPPKPATLPSPPGAQNPPGAQSQSSETPTWVNALAGGQIFLAAILASSLVFPAPETLDAVINARKTLLARLRDQGTQKKQLDDALDAFLALKVATWRNRDDEILFKKWRAAVATLKSNIAGLATSDLATQARGDLQQAINILETTHPS